MRWSIVGSSVKFRLLVITLAVALLAIGIVQLRDTPVEAFPDLGPVRVEGGSASALDTIVVATQEMRGPIPWVTSIIISVVPVLVLGEGSGAFLRPPVLTYALAVLVSMVVALTVTPACPGSRSDFRAPVRPMAGAWVRRPPAHCRPPTGVGAGAAAIVTWAVW